MKENHIAVRFSSIGENIAIARMMLSGFVSQYDLSIAQLDEMKIALSEAVSNAIIHGYQQQEDKEVFVEMSLKDDILELVIKDDGIGIQDISLAMEPAYSTKEDHMGLGFAFMNSFMDELIVKSAYMQGTCVTMRRKLSIHTACISDAV